MKRQQNAFSTLKVTYHQVGAAAVTIGVNEPCVSPFDRLYALKKKNPE